MTAALGLRGRILGWWLPALAGTLAPLGAGFYASAEANRIAYAAWGLAGAVVWIAVLRLWVVRRPRTARTGAAERSAR